MNRSGNFRRLGAAAGLLALLGSGGCCININTPEPPPMAVLAVGGEPIIRPLLEAGLEPAARAVRERVREAGFIDPWPMLSTDGRGLLIEDRGDPHAPLLVWSDWVLDDKPQALEGAAKAQLISSKHFIFERGGEQWVAALATPEHASPVDPAFDPQMVRALPQHDLWCTAIGNRLYIGPLDGGALSAATISELDREVRGIAVLEREAIALVDTGDGVVTAWDLTTASRTGLRIDGAIDWPWATFFAAPTIGALQQAGMEGSTLPLDAIAVIHPEGAWSVGSLRGGLRVEPADWSITLVDSTVEMLSLEPGQRRLPGGSEAPPRGSGDYRGIVWPPRESPDAASGELIPYLAMTPWWPEQG